MKIQDSPTISTLLPSSALSFFLSTSLIEARILQEICFSSCRDINISCPFRLTIDPLACGSYGFEFSCQDNKPIFEFHSGKYYVKQISYGRRIIRLVDINLANGSCSLPYNSLSVDEVRGDSRYRELVSSTFTSFVKCTNEINDQAYREVPCLSGTGDQIYVSHGTYIILIFKDRVPSFQGCPLFIKLF